MYVLVFLDLEGVKKYLKNVGVQVNVETVVRGNKEATGAVGIHYPSGVQSGQPFDTAYPRQNYVFFSSPTVTVGCYPWIWLLNRYSVTTGETSYET